MGLKRTQISLLQCTFQNDYITDTPLQPLWWTTTEIKMISFDVFNKFLDLPAEIRCMIYREYFGPWTASIYHDELVNAFRLTGCPDMSISMASRQLREETRSIVLECFSGKLHLRDVRLHGRGCLGFRSSLEIIAAMGINRILNRVHTVTLENGTTGMLGLLPWHILPRLERIELEECLTANPIEAGKISKYWPFDSELDKNGEAQIQGVIGYKDWSYVPAAVAARAVRVISLRREYVAGACFKAVVEYTEHGGKLIERIRENGSGG